jgi:hypothetical protein
MEIGAKIWQACLSNTNLHEKIFFTSFLRETSQIGIEGGK